MKRCQKLPPTALPSLPKNTNTNENTNLRVRVRVQVEDRFGHMPYNNRGVTCKDIYKAYMAYMAL